MVLFTAATNGHLAVKPRARTEHVTTATVKTEAHTTSPCFGEALNVDVFNSRNFESAMQARLAQMPSRHQRLERAFDFQSGFSPKLERQPLFFDVVGGKNRDQHLQQQQQHVYGVRDRDREEDAQEQNKRMRVHDADEMPPLLSPGRHAETPCLSLMGESSVPGPNYGEPNYSGNVSMSLMASEHRSLTRSPSTGNALDEPSPLGLTLKKTPSLVDLIVMQLRSDESSPNADSIAAEAAKIRSSAKCLVPSAIGQDKMKASNFPASSLKVGTWERTSRYEGDLVGKCYYAKRKLVWEVLENGLKSKIEIQWSDISAMKASCPENLPGTLEIEVSRPPLFFRETNPQPRKHTLWQTASDFTGGQATICKRHSLQFPEGVLNKHYEKLVQCDPRLKALAEGAPLTKPMPDFLDINSMAWMLDAKRQFQHLPAAHQPIGGHHDGGPDENACDLPIPNPRHLHSLLGTGLLHAGALLSDPKSEVKLNKTQPTDLSSSSPGMDSRGNSGDSGTTSDTDDMRVQDDFAEYGIDLQYSTQTSSLSYDELCEVKPSYKNLYMLGGTTSPQDRRLQEISQGLTDDIGGSIENVIANGGGARHSGQLSSGGLVEESLLPALPLRWDPGHPFSHAPVVKTEAAEGEELGWPFSYCPPNDRLFAENSLMTSSFNKAHASESDLLVTMPRVPSVQFMDTLPPQVVYEMQHSRPTYRSHAKLR